MKREEIDILKDRILSGGSINKEEAIALSKTTNKSYLYQTANEIRAYFMGNAFDLCSIQNAKSGACSEDCKWCSQSAHNKADVEVYNMVSSKVAVAMAKQNEAYGVKKFSLVTSGRSISNKNLKSAISIYKDIKKESNIKLCASMGLLTREKLIQLRDTGIEHYHCNLETSKRFFPTLCTTHTYEEKIETIKMAQSLGIKVCSGGIIGMGESMEDRIDLALDLSRLGILSIPINILNPIEGTSLQGTQSLEKEEVLTSIALFRMINPKANLRFAGGRNMIKSYQDEALKAGINAALVGDLLTTTGSSGVKEDKAFFQDSGFDV